MRPFPVSHWGSGGFNSPQSLFLPLTNSLIPDIALGTSTPTYSANGSTGENTCSIVDWEAIVRKTDFNEARFLGARRVKNRIVGNSQNFTNASWLKANGGAGSVLPVATANYTTDPLGGSTASRIQMTMGTDPVAGYAQVYQVYPQQPLAPHNYLLSMWIKSNSGTPTVSLSITEDTSNRFSCISVTLTSSWVRYCIPVFVSTSVTNVYPLVAVMGTLYGGSGNTQTAVDISVWGAMFEEVSGQSNQNPAEYVSVGVAASPFHGCNIDRIKYFKSKNGNTVASNIVTEATGADITSANGGSALTTDTRGPMGFLWSEGYSNSFGIGETLNSFATKTGVTIGSNVTAAPNGEVIADSMIETAANSTHVISDFFNRGSSSVEHDTLTGFFKAGIRDKINFRCYDISSNGAEVEIDLTAQTVSAVTKAGTYVAGVSGIVAYPNGWFKVWFSFSTGTVNGTTIDIFMRNSAGSATYAGTNGAIGIYAWGIMFRRLFTTLAEAREEQYATANSGRAADALDYVFASNASATVGTAYAEVRARWTAGAPTIAPIVAFGTNPTFPLYLAAGDAATTVKASDGTNVVQCTGIGSLTTAVRKVASSWTGSTLRVCGYNQAAVSGTFDGNMGSTKIAIGAPTTFTGLGFNGTIRNLRIYTGAATSAELASITAGAT